MPFILSAYAFVYGQYQLDESENYTGGWIKNGLGKSVRENVRRIGWTKEIKGWGMGARDRQPERKRERVYIESRWCWTQGISVCRASLIIKAAYLISVNITHVHTPLLYIQPVNIVYTLSGKVPLTIHPVNITQNEMTHSHIKTNQETKLKKRCLWQMVPRKLSHTLF